ncbi:PQQ-dependent sugar dehydrogenase [Sphingomonas sp.]|uniref:PQQ-dependent sugar dehydrogenase n=1 Tax=Sphingomonas sp. TaxID=28214 RepID=UPI0025EBB19B|nr:PQQ-dependent sugar dehydrogenase [Sphingomonas sp.]
MNRMVLQAMLAASLLAGCQSRGHAQHESTGPRPFTVTEIASFSTPWAMAFLPGSGVPLTDMALLTEKEGNLWLVDVASGKRTAVSGVPAVVVAGQGGLGDVMPHPDFAGNHRVYLSYVEGGPDGTSGAALGYGTLDLANPAAPALKDFKVIWRQDPKVDSDVHFSHRIAFAPDGTLFVSSGERFKFTPAQDPNSDLGKIIHITDEGQRIDGRYYSMGHRNVLGLSFAPDGRLWASEMGPKGGDELNLILPGRNYGWPKVSNGSHYDGRDIPDHKPGDGFEAPKVWWNPSISPGSLLIYSGDKFPAWKGDALLGALSGEALVRVDIDGDNARKADQWDMGARIRAVDQGPDGSVYLLEDNGRLLRLDPAAAH